MNKFPRDILNKIKWADKNLNKVKIYYISRGSTNGIASRVCNNVKEIGTSFIIFSDNGFYFSKRDVHIPYHRIVKIEYKEEIIFNRTSQQEEKQ